MLKAIRLQEPSGTIVTCLHSTVMACEVPSSCTTQMILTPVFMTSMMVRTMLKPFFDSDCTDVTFHVETTIITLADWYHTLAREGLAFP